MTSATQPRERRLIQDGAAVFLSEVAAGRKGGRPLLLLHGSGMDHRAWGATVAVLAAAGALALAPDLPGHGQSEGSPLAAISDLAAWVVRLTRSLGLERPVLAGHSMGALVALEGAAELGAEAGGLALVGAAAEMPVNPALLEAARSEPGRAAEMIAGWAYGPAAQADGRAEAGRRLFGAAGPGVLAADLGACQDYRNAAHALRRVRCPVLVVAGEKDKMTPPKRGRALAEAIPGARYEELAGIGHMLPEESPERLAALVLDLVS